MRVECAIVLGLCATACEDPRPIPAMAPVGAPDYVTIAGQRAPRFDAQRPPTVRVEGPVEPGRLERWSAWVEVDGAPRRLPTRIERIDGLAFVRAAVSDAPPGPTTLTLREGDRALGRWRMHLGPAPAPPRYRDAARDLEALDARPPQTAEERRWWHFTRGLALWRAGRLDPAIEAMRASADDGPPDHAARALRMAGNLALRRGRLTDAAAWLDDAAALAGRADDRAGRSTARYLRAEVARMRGALRDAEAHARAAEAHARAVGRLDLADYARVIHAVVRQTMGHHREARAMLTPLAGRADGMPADLEAVVRGNLGWVLLEGIERGVFDAAADGPIARRAFERALELNAGRAAPTANHHANLAALALLGGDLAAVDHHVAAHDAIDPERRQHSGLFVDLVEARRRLAAGDAGAAEAFAAVERRALAEAGDVTGDYVWRARLGRARALRAAGDHPAALDAFRGALAARATAATRTGLQDSRATFFADHRALYDEAIAAALEAGRVAEAFEIADRARARLVIDLEARTRVDRLDPAQRAAWQARLDAYLTRRQVFEASRGEGGMLTPAERPAWRARRAAERRALQAAFDDAYAWLDAVAPIAVRGATAAAVQAALAPDEALWLTHPGGARWRVRPAGVERMTAPTPLPTVAHRYVVGAPPGDGLAHGTLSRLNHAGQLLDARTPAEGPPLVVGDPDGTLPHARREARAVAAGWPGARVLIGSAADRAAVRAALGDARRVHFAGHGVLVGLTPWDAHLRLAGRERLTLEDLLLARPGAALVVLSGCETGAEAPVGGDIRLGLAQGFLAAGSRAVVAADRAVPDGETADFVERFYAADGARRPAEALRAAALALKADGRASWDAWHVWGRR